MMCNFPLIGRSLLIGAAFALGVSSARADAADYVWWEAETPLRGNFPRQNPFRPANADEASKLSSGAWIGVSGPRREPLYLEYDIHVPADGNWQLYTRKFWRHGPYRFRFDDGVWQSVGADAALLDDVQIRTHVAANWTRAGDVTLSAGKHRLRVELLEKDGAAAFDCFVLTRAAFVARGKMKPDAKYGASEPGWFAFEPDPDPATSPIDLRFLNEPLAGSKGFIAPRDGRFIHSATGEPVRFWGVNAGPGVWTLDDTQLGALADSLARRGVNLIRLHGPAFLADGPQQGQTDPAAIDRIQRIVAIMKTRGIYTTLSIYYPLWIKLDAANGWPGYKQQNPFAILFWDERLQQLHRAWWRSLMSGPNPHGPKLADEPAILSCELQNEDSLFFWTFQPYERVPAEAMTDLEKRFAQWLIAKYGSIDAAFTAWKSEKVKGDAPGEGRVGICIPWRLFNVRDARSKDTAAFLAQVQIDFYSATRAFLKEDLGVKSMVSASNWVTASPMYLTPIERYTNVAGDFIDRHGYFVGVSEGEGAAWSIRTGNKYSDRSVLRADSEKPGAAKRDYYSPIGDVQFDDKPTMLSEIEWPEPNRFRGEMPVFCAAYASLQDLDAIIFFAVGGPGWSQTLAKFPLQTPVALGQYPAAALIYRQGLLSEAPVVVDITLNVREMLALSGWSLALPASLDETRKIDAPPDALADLTGGVDGRAAHVGRMRVRFAADDTPSSTRSARLADFIDDQHGTIRSATGELFWDAGRGVLRIDAPRAQGVSGFTGKTGAVETRDATFDLKSEFATALLVPLDGHAIADSKRLLLQVMTEQKPFGWQTAGEGLKTITNVGQPPMMVREIAGTIRIKRPDAASLVVRPMALNGAMGNETIDGAAMVQLRKDVIYYLIEAK